MPGKPRWLRALLRLACCAGLNLLGTTSPGGTQTQESRQWLEFSQVYKGRPAGFYYLASNNRPAVCDVALAALNEARATVNVGPEDLYEEFLLGSTLKPRWAKVKDSLSWRVGTADFTKVRILGSGTESVVYRRYRNYSSNYFAVMYATELELEPETTIDMTAHHRITGSVIGTGQFDGSYENELQIHLNAARRNASEAAWPEDVSWLLAAHSGQMLELMLIEQRAYVLVSKMVFWRKPIAVALLEFHEPRRATLHCHFRSRFGFDGQAVRK